MSKMFISYRRDDADIFAGRLCDRLRGEFGSKSVFFDVDAIPFGVDFRDYIEDALSSCQVVLVIVGEEWIHATKDGKRRLDDPRDYVRIEVETALAKSIPVVPITIGNTPMPSESELPESLRKLAFRNACPVDPGRDFHLHVDRLVEQLARMAFQSRSTEPTRVLQGRGSNSTKTGSESSLLEGVEFDVADVSSGVRLWHARAADPPFISVNATLFFRRFKEAFDRRDLDALADCFSERYSGDVYGAGTKRELLNQLSNNVFGYLPRFMSVRYTLNIYHLAEDSAERISAIVNSEIRISFLFIPWARRFDNARILLEARPEGQYGVFRISELRIHDGGSETATMGHRRPRLKR